MSRPQFLSKFAEANPEKVKRLENEILRNVDYSQEDSGKAYCFTNTFSFFLQVLPPLHRKEYNFVEHWSSVVFDCDMRDDLERNGVINWCPKASRLFPIKVKSDGNCLIHAICTAVWGIEDVGLNVRRLLAITLQSDPHQRFQTRWKQYQKNQDREMFDRPSLNTVTLDDNQWEREWAQVLHSARGDSAATTGIAAMPYTQLEAVHVYVLANIFKRPIILLGRDSIHTFSGSSLQANNLMGIYLPLERDPIECCPIPVILGFSMNHFCPLLGLDTQFDVGTSKLDDYLPLILANNSALPVRFLMDAGEERRANDLLKKYLKLKEFKSNIGTHVGAVIDYKPMPPPLNLLQDYKANFERLYREYYSQPLEANIRAERPPVQARYQYGNQQSGSSQLNAQQPVGSVPPSTRPAAADPMMQEASNVFTPVPCKTPNCEFFGNPAQGGMCTQCLQQHLKSESSRLQSQVPEAMAAEPSAPPPSMPLESTHPNVSLMGELCHGKCGYRCSSKTFPYCHKCAEKNRREALKKMKNEQRDPARGGSPPRLSSMDIEVNMRAGAAETSKVNDKHIAESQESGFSQGELYGLGTQLSSPMQESCAEISPSDIACITPQCARKGKANQGNRCNQCFVENAPATVTAAQHASPTVTAAQHAQIAPAKVSPMPQMEHTPIAVELSSYLQSAAGGFSKCVTPECVNPGFPGNSGYCTNCAIKLIEAKQYKPADVKIEKKICSSPGCEGMRLQGEKCETCFQQLHRRPPSPVENMAMAEVGESNDLETGIIESGTPSGVSVGCGRQVVYPEDKKKCASPMCSTMIYPPASLCEACLTILRCNSSTQSRVPTTSLSQPEQQGRHTAPIGKRCIMPGCDKLGDPSTADMCISCYGYQFVSNVGTSAQPPVVNREERRSFTAPILVPGPIQPQRSQSAQHGKKCTVTNCQRYGDPATGNMCTTCYHKHLSTPPAPLWIEPAVGAAPEGSDDRFNKMMTKVANTRKIQKICKKSTCDNYGNPTKEGFCNSCYPEYQKMKNRMLWAGEDRCG
ncbi:tumor necrosis factor alpha-induced protein 3-like [Gigantopelta aegis]|uniref:tumor necrosis factor alpha-induced protein 3-like n=1 Tax=Gigantopelta aegis TaxID=1735272 RepID=UPI001B88740A|nr:tumor necrosis factor alpha-induced protein 3-like [Gigantopelta aegis]XP_041354856.1 tumor necrosis factor alpha-induced protein 3-like [Gigantopelta aegis]XP_041354858.1 tumor necrosis factor alpha-induced protein 3-like [Gigantopelta aegis]